MSNLNEKYFTISERCGRNHQNKFCLRPLKGRLGPWEFINYSKIFYVLKNRNSIARKGQIYNLVKRAGVKSNFILGLPALVHNLKVNRSINMIMIDNHNHNFVDLCRVGSELKSFL